MAEEAAQGVALAPLLVANNVHKWFGTVEVLRGVSLSVYPGEVVALIGPSGSGKTTFLRCMNHLESYEAGTIYFDGELVGYKVERGKVFERDEHEVAAARSKMGMVFQHFNLFPHMSAVDNVAYGPRRVLGIPKIQARKEARDLLARVGLAGREDAYPSGLSGGQQQRVGIARALAMKPQMLLLDEPTSALDPELVGEVLDVVREVVELGMTMVIVTHEIRFAREVADRIVVMNDGLILESGPPGAVIDNPQDQRVRQFLRREKSSGHL